MKNLHYTKIGILTIFFSSIQEMCKVESSTDSDSEISPRWSDTSTLVFLLYTHAFTRTMSFESNTSHRSQHLNGSEMDFTWFRVIYYWGKKQTIQLFTSEFLFVQGGVSSAPESDFYRRALPLPLKPAGRASCCSVVNTFLF